MKLELKHLAPYLPYELNILLPFEVKPMIGLDKKQVILGYTGEVCVFGQKKEFKPILRPLSDLKNEIEYKGERFTPIEYLDSVLTPVDFFEDTDHYDYLINWINSTDKSHHIQFLPYGLINQLLEWHFDVFDLIKNDLAIDINTLNKK